MLIRHIPVDASQPHKDSTIGSIGSDMTMDNDGRVWSSLRVFDQEAIDYIESRELGELSAGYSYTPDMTAGTWNGKPYDGIMRNIHGNHVAIVNRGRIGSDAIIADSLEGQLMAKKIVLKNGSLAKLQQQLGMDSAELKKTIVAVHKALALDEKEEKAEDEDDEKSEKAEDEDEDEKDKKQAEDDDSDVVEDEEDDDKKEAEDEDDEEDKKDDKKKGTAMDAASLRQSVMSIFKAGREVEPLVGVIALDGFTSDRDVYAYALKQKGIDTKGINTAGLAALVKAQKAGNLAMDTAQKPSGNVSKEVNDSLSRFG